MNFMIDGAYGDLYRAAMLQPQRFKSDDEWEAERRLSEINAQPRGTRRQAAARISRLIAGFLAVLSPKGRQAAAPRHLSPRA